MLELRLLGPPALALDGGAAPPELLWRKHLALLAYLALSPRRARTRDHLVGLLWGDKAETSARHSLREAIRVIRQALGPAAIETEGQLVRLTDAAVRLDTEAFAACAGRGAWDEAARLVAGDFMDGFGVAGASPFEDWLAATRAEWRRRLAEAAVHVARACLRDGRTDEARRAAARALAAEPLSDLAVQSAMQAEALAGDPSAALQVFGTFERRSQEAETAPGAETAALAERIRSGRLRPRPPRGRGPEAWTRRAPLAGRGPALESLMTLWDAVRARAGAAVAIVEGDLGSGKTRVIEEVAGRIALAGGATVARALAVRADRDEPGSGIQGLALGGLLDAPGVAAAPPGALGGLAARLPAWADRFPGARADETGSLAAAFRAVTIAALDEQPLVLAVDEAHWLDDESLDALLMLVRDARARPLLLLLSVMPGAQSPVLDDLRRNLGGAVHGRPVTLEPLDTAELRTLATWALPAFGPDALDRVTRRLVNDTAGIPLLAVELLHAITLGLEPSGGEVVWPLPARTLSQTLPAELPDGVVAAVRVSFRGLTPGAQRVLAGMAVLSERVAEDEIGRAVELPLADVRRALDELEWQRWITSDARGYAFVARIVRDIVGRDMLTAGQRRRIAAAAGRPPG
jgi:DNA-binding SARP family transcriptional activator